MAIKAFESGKYYMNNNTVIKITHRGILGSYYYHQVTKNDVIQLNNVNSKSSIIAMQLLPCSSDIVEKVELMFTKEIAKRASEQLLYMPW